MGGIWGASVVREGFPEGLCGEQGEQEHLALRRRGSQRRLDTSPCPKGKTSGWNMVRLGEALEKGGWAGLRPSALLPATASPRISTTSCPVDSARWLTISWHQRPVHRLPPTHSH